MINLDRVTGDWHNSNDPANGQQGNSGLVRGALGSWLLAPGERQTVRGQLTSLLKSDSPYMRTSEKKGQQYAASRGLTNSTLAGQAGMAAAIQAGLPIAAADAASMTDAAKANQQALNTAEMMDMQRQIASSTGGRGGGGGGGGELGSELEHERRKELMRLESSLRREESSEDRKWRSGESLEDRLWRSGESALDRNLNSEQFWAQLSDRERDRMWRSDESALDRGLTRDQWEREMAETARDRDFTREMEEVRFSRMMEQMGAQGKMDLFGSVLQMAMGTMFSSPDFFRDPDGAAGFIEFFTGDVFGKLFSQFFGGGSGNSNNAQKPATGSGG